MRRTAMLVGLAAMIGISLGDAAFARHYSRGRRGGFGGTAAMASMMGYASLLRAQAAANLQNSQAAINWEKAKTAEIQNRLLWTETYFQMRRINHDMRLAERGPSITGDQANAFAQAEAPKPLDLTQLDPATGRVSYPTALRDPQYDGLRYDVDLFFRQRARTHGSVDFNELQHVETILDLFHDAIHGNVASYAAGDYGQAVTFLEQLKREAKMPVR